MLRFQEKVAQPLQAITLKLSLPIEVAEGFVKQIVSTRPGVSKLTLTGV